jgi:hypothetical protein
MKISPHFGPLVGALDPGAFGRDQTAIVALRYEGRAEPWICPHGGHATYAEMIACLLEADRAMAERESVELEG